MADMPDYVSNALWRRNILVARPRKIPPTKAELTHLDGDIQRAAERFRKDLAERLIAEAPERATRAKGYVPGHRARQERRAAERLQEAA